MKYVIGFILVLLVVKIDYVLRTFDELTERFSQGRPPVLSSEGFENSSTLPLKDDQALQSNPRQIFLLMLERFGDAPEETFRQTAFEIIQKNSDIFGEALDQELMGTIYSWRDLIGRKEKQLPLFLVDLMNVLKGENHLMIRRFYSLLMDADAEWFFSTYILTKDIQCAIATDLGDPLSAEEKLNVLFDRERSLNEFVQSEKIDPDQKLRAESCLLRLRQFLAELAPKTPATAPIQPDVGDPE